MQCVSWTKSTVDHYTVPLFMQLQRSPHRSLSPTLLLSPNLSLSLSLSLPPTLTLCGGNTPDSLLARSPDHSSTFSQPRYTHSHYTPTTHNTHTHTHTHTYSHKHSTHLLTVTIHVSLAVAKLQAPTKFFAANESLLLSPLVLTDTPFCWNTLFLLWLHLFPGFRLGLLFSRPFTFFHGFPCFDLISVCSKAQSLFNFPCVHLRSGTQRGILFEEFL